jgi:Cu/Ag efflux protein CusF
MMHSRARLFLCFSLVFGALVTGATQARLEVAIARAAQSYAATGIIQSIARDRSSLTIAHEAIVGFMPAMTMSFEARSPVQLANVHEKDRVSFTFTVTDDARRVIDTIAKR